MMIKALTHVLNTSAFICVKAKQQYTIVQITNDHGENRRPTDHNYHTNFTLMVMKHVEGIDITVAQKYLMLTKYMCSAGKNRKTVFNLQDNDISSEVSHRLC
jgi:hypothetical protein